MLNIILNILFPQKCFGCGKEKETICKKCQQELLHTCKNESKKIISATCYQSRTIKKAVRAIKYRQAKSVAKPFAELIHTRLTHLNYQHPMSIVIIPIPIHKKRLRKRGYNQAGLIAKHLSDIMSVKMLNNVLYKNCYTTPQVEVRNRKERLKNLKDSFSIKNKELIKGKEILLIDDVSTTGATINEASKTLKKAGAKKVTGVVVAS